MSPKPRADVFLPPEEDPRNDEPVVGGEREVLMAYLQWQRQTLDLKCSGLDADQLARRSVPPSTMSLLGLVRHMADVERAWFRRRMAKQTLPRLFGRDAEPDADFDGAVADPDVVAEAWQLWAEEKVFADEFIQSAESLEVLGDVDGTPVTLREVLVHMVEEYARHNGHADLLRECIDGRIGQ
jgi:uncharacterized damage-inducible protein DinB